MALTGLDIFKLLPKTNCKKCGQPTCLAFAMQLAQKKVALAQCPDINEAGKKALEGAAAPPIRLVAIGEGGKKLQIGQENVLFRHEEKFYRPTGVAVTIEDTLDDAAFSARLEKINNLKFTRVGAQIEVDLVAVVNKSGKADAFAAAAQAAAGHSPLNIVLMSESPEAMKAAVAVCGAKKPLIAELHPLRRPPFFAIISSHLQAAALHSDPKTRPDGFVVEGSDAGGHNAPPREKRRDERGYYVYGPEDVADLDAVAAIGLPFWVAGGWGYPERLKSAQGSWRPHLQVGTLFALAAESAMEPTVRRRVLDLIWHRDLEVVSHATASPSTYPFKVALVPGTLGDPAVYDARERVCNIGHLRGWRPNGNNPVGLCPADAEDCFIRAGGAPWRTRGSMCLCNSLLATRGLGQPGEPAVVTLGDITSVRRLQSKLKRMDYSAREAVDYLLDG
jgi:NAD(P)H-dependent flavin oxidoreductase YrpB (nitropropane dioxygenase family)